MKRRNKNLVEFELRHMGLFQAPRDEMDGAAERIQRRLRATPLDSIEEPPTNFLVSTGRWHPLGLALAIGAVFAITLVVFFKMPPKIDAPAVLTEGSLSRNSSGEVQVVRAGESIEAGEIVKTNDSNGWITLADDSRVEMRAQTELFLERAEDGLRIRLSRGGVIVNAAKQSTGHLYVQTHDVMVSVVGTVFLVNAEMEGSRVAVIEGEVRVQHGSTLKKLLPGEQVTTSPSLEQWPVGEEISWSRNAESHLALLQQSVPQKTSIVQEAFEIASIRLNNSTSGAPSGGPRCPPFQIQIDPAQFIVTNMSLYNLIALAYGKNCPAAEVLSGGPDWIKTDHFDIHALIPPDTPLYTPRQFREGEAPMLQRMLQKLLENRFKVQVHHETKLMSAYELTVIKEGKLKLSGNPSDRVPQPVRPGMRGFNSPEISISSFVGVLQGMVGRPVIDKTGLKGLFEIRLEFPVDASFAPATDAQPGPDIPSLLEVLQDQLGLRLESTKGFVEVLKIEHAERPTEN